MNTSNKLLGASFELDNKKYRLIYASGNAGILCELDTTKLSLTYYSLDELENKNIIVLPEENFIIDFDKMSEKELNEYNYRKSIIEQINKEYGPTYMGLLGKQKKQLINDIIDKEHISKSTLWLWIRKYLQSGMNDNSLVDVRYHATPRKFYHYNKKTGRPTKYNVQTGIPLTNEVLMHFDSALNQIKFGREMTINKAYFWMIRKYYSYQPDPTDKAVEWLPISERPTLNQFYYYVKKHFSKLERDIAKSSEMDVRNNHRLLLSSSRTDAYRPGKICECDALEADLSIISELDPDQSIGRPIVYMMIDVYTSMIVAVSASFQNNSYIGLTNLMLNLGTDKVDYARRYDIIIQPDMWRSCFIPDSIRCDRGSDFASDDFGTVCTRLGIKRDLVTPGTGSMKGLIEETFASFQKSFRANLENKGLITKRHDSNHHKESLLTLKQFTQMLINFVITHNQKTLINYPMTADMLRTKDFEPIPTILWDYGCNKYGEPKYITNAIKNQYLYDLLIEKTAYISRKGITLSGLVYVNETDKYLLNKMYEAGQNKKQFIVRCDPRDVSKIYYMYNNELHIADLNIKLNGQIDYLNMSWLQYREYNHKRKDINNKGKADNLHLDFILDQAYDFIVDNANGNKSTYSKTTNMKQARKTEKHVTDYNNRVSTHLNNNQQIDSNTSITSIEDNSSTTNDTTSNVNDLTLESNETKEIPIDNTMNDLLDALEEHRTKGSE